MTNFDQLLLDRLEHLLAADPMLDRYPHVTLDRPAGDVMLSWTKDEVDYFWKAEPAPEGGMHYVLYAGAYVGDPLPWLEPLEAHAAAMAFVREHG